MIAVVRDLVSPLAQIAAAAVGGVPVVLPPAELERDFVYGRDVARALVALLFASRPGHRVYNVSTEDDWSGLCARWCGELAQVVPGFEWRVAQPAEPASIAYHDTRPRARMDTTKLRTDLGFVPAFPAGTALRDYARWLVSTDRGIETGGDIETGGGIE